MFPFTGLGSVHDDNVLRGAANMLRNLAELPEGSTTESAEAALRSAVDGVVQRPDLAQDAIQELKGFRIERDGNITLEPAWYQARAFVWLLGIRQKVLQQHNLAHDAYLQGQLNDAMQLIR